MRTVPNGEIGMRRIDSSMDVRRLALIVILALPSVRAVCAVFTNPGLADGPVIRIDDVGRFYTLYDAAGSRPTADQLQRDYLDVGSDGLHIFAKIRNITGANMAATLAKTPAIYSDAKRCAAVLPAVRERVNVAMVRLASLYPSARFPPVTLAVGRGRPVGCKRTN
jgi:hypothetical protein